MRRAIATAVVLLLAGASGAGADSASVAVTTAAGVPDALAGAPRIVTVSGFATAPERVYVKHRAAGEAPCAASAQGDAGTVLTGFYAESVEGAFSLQDVIAWSAPGDVLFCTWLSDGNAETLTPPIAQVVAFRGPDGSIGAAVATARPQRGRLTRIDVTGSSETPAVVFASVRATGAASCPATWDAESGQRLIDGATVSGDFSLRSTVTPAKGGRHLVCLWLARTLADPSPIAGPLPLTFVAAAASRPRCAPPPARGRASGSPSAPARRRCTSGRSRRAPRR